MISKGRACRWKAILVAMDLLGPMWQGDVEWTRRATETADALTARLKGTPEVAAVIYIGGLARGRMDRFSDLDIIALLYEESRQARDGIASFVKDSSEGRLDIDLEVHTLEHFTAHERNEIFRWDLSHCRLAYDREGRADALIRDIVHMSETDWKDRTVLQVMLLQWYIFPGDGYLSLPEVWRERGDMRAAHHCLDFGIGLVMDLLFALNRQFVPPAKWKLEYLQELAELPDGIDAAISEAMITKAFDEKELERRLAVLRSLWEPLMEMAERKVGMDQEQMTQHYVSKLM